MLYKALGATLAFLSIAVLALPPDISRPTTLVLKSPLPASPLPVSSLESKDEVDWEDHEDHCSTSYFKFTYENIVESNLFSFYVNFREQSIKNNPEEFERSGEVVYFGEKILKQPNFDCGIEKNGCHEAPSCETILKRTKSENRNRKVTIEEIKSQTRQKYFVVLALQTIGRFLHTFDNLLVRAQVAILGRIPLIIRRFTSQVDSNEELERQIKKHVWDMSWSLVQLALGTMFDIKSGDKPGQWNLPLSPMGPIGWGMSTTKTFIEFGAETAGTLAYLDRAKLEAAVGSSTSTGRLHTVQSYASDLFGRYQIDETHANIANGQDYAVGSLTAARKIFKAFTIDLFNGSLGIETEKITPALSFFMTADAQSSLKAAEVDIAREENLAQLFVKDAIALVYGSQQCYVACKHEQSIAKVDESCPKPKLNFEKPFCSREPPYEVCVSRCWGAKSGKEKLFPLYGAELLNEYNTTETELISDALAEQRRLGWGQSASHADKVLHKVFQLGGPHGIGDTMPLCASEYINLKPKKWGFPCQCGPWDSNGTKIFMEKVGLHPNNVDFESKPNTHTLTQVCPRYLGNRLPAARFKLFCDLNIGFPRTDRGHYGGPGRWDFRMEKDPLCDEILPQLVGKTDIEASQFFCEMKKVRYDLQRHERELPRGMPGVWNHWDLCKWYKKRNYEKALWDS